ncbi:MAG: hypothetical protein GY855_16455, partial [candidate division Zixibacteria bacterium]|nr:hypothetical protein [candidate division Zixibacteria bacterium]
MFDIKIKDKKLKPGESTEVEVKLKKDVRVGKIVTSFTFEAKNKPNS